MNEGHINCQAFHFGPSLQELSIRNVVLLIVLRCRCNFSFTRDCELVIEIIVSSIDSIKIILSFRIQFGFFAVLLGLGKQRKGFAVSTQIPEQACPSQSFFLALLRFLVATVKG